jgi:hypothetical protein
MTAVLVARLGRGMNGLLSFASEAQEVDRLLFSVVRHLRVRTGNGHQDAHIEQPRFRNRVNPARKLRLSGVHVEDFDLASCYTAAFDPRVGGDQGDVESFGQGDILSVVGGQVGMKALQARPQG